MGKCRRCYDSRRLSLRRFNGRREQVLARDGCHCVNCGSTRVVVHHRNRRLFVTLCLACHARVHRTSRLRFGRLTQFLETLWREQHAGQPEQLLLPSFETPASQRVDQMALFAA